MHNTHLFSKTVSHDGRNHTTRNISRTQCAHRRRHLQDRLPPSWRARNRRDHRWSDTSVSEGINGEQLGFRLVR